MMDRICMTLGGRVSEEIIFGPENITTGAQDDLQKITRMAFEACANYGMNTIIGPVSYGGREGQKESWTKPFSEKTGEMLDAEVRKMITYLISLFSLSSLDDLCYISSSAHQRTTDLLTLHREDVEKVAKLLLVKEVITRYAT
jgi:AFG3 family protein